MPNFEIDCSSNELKESRQKINDLTEANSVVQDFAYDRENTRWIDSSERPTRQPLTSEQYNERLAHFEQEYSDEKVLELRTEYATKSAPALDAYNKLKLQLLADAARSGDPNPAKLVFDDAAMRIGIDYGFKECVDRFSPQALAQIKAVVSPDPQNDNRKYQDIFRENLATPEVRQRYDALLDRATNEYRAEGAAAYKEPEEPLHFTPGQQTPDNLHAAFANANQGICLDDDHGNAVSPNFLAAQMSVLKAEGVTTLFVEHFWQEQQEMLNAYQQAPPGAPLPAPLHEAVRKLDSTAGGGTAFTQLLAAAKQEGIRVVGLDSFEAKTPEQGDPRKWDHRVARFNTLAAEVVDNTLKAEAAGREGGPGKFVLLAGEKHNNTHDCGFPGMAQILGVPAVQVAGDKLALSPEKKEDRGMRTEAEQRYYDAFVDTFMNRQPEVFRPVAGDFGETNKAQNRGLAVRQAGDALAREHGATLENLSPKGIESLAGQAADRTLAGLDLSRLGTSPQIEPTEILTAARSRSGASADAAKEMRGAVERRDVAGISTVLQNNPHDDRLLLLGAVANDGSTLLHMAADRHDGALTKLLLDRGCDPDRQDRQGDTALHKAIANVGNKSGDRDVAVARALFEGGARVDLVNVRGNTPVNALYCQKYNIGDAKDARPTQAALDQIDQMLSVHADYIEARQMHATEPGQETNRVVQLFSLVRAGDLATVQALPPNDPLLNETLGGRNLVHVAAEGRHLDVLKGLVGKGADITVKDDFKNNALHYACKDGADHPEIVKELLDRLGAAAAEPNNLGKTPLHLAAESNLPAVTAVVLADPNRNAFNIQDKSKLVPLDYAVCMSDKSRCEQAFYAADPSMMDESRQKPPQQNPSVVDTLVWMTRAENPTNFPNGFLEKLYGDLYADPMLRPVLEVAARDGMGSRIAEPGERQALRIVMADNIAALAGTGGMGNYMDQGNRLNFGGKQGAGDVKGKGHWEDSVKGTLAHELTHHAAAVVYKNDGLPFRKDDEAGKLKYIKAFEDDVRLNSHLAITAEETEVVRCISSRMDAYQKDLNLDTRKFSNEENKQLEMIVGVSQAVAQFGSPLVEKLYPNFTEHFKKDFTDAVTQSCTQNPVFRAAQIDTGENVINPKAVATMPDKQFVSKSEVSKFGIDSSKIWKMVEDEFTFAKGQPTIDGALKYRAGELTLNDPDRQKLAGMKDDVMKQLNKTLSKGELPPQLSTEAVRDLARAVSQTCGNPALSAADRQRQVANAGANFAVQASNHFEHDYLRSSKLSLDRKTSKGYTLETRDIAELVIVRGAEMAGNRKAVDGGLSVNPKKYEKAVDALTKQMEKFTPAELTVLKQSPALLRDIVEAQAKTLVHEGGFYQKPHAVTPEGTHVSIKTSALKRA